tara:strand:- start:1580 stop:1777 length:198 start_codon:yes stop_codon:yes gene_type:complete
MKMSKERIKKLDEKFGLKPEVARAHVATQVKRAIFRRRIKLGLQEGEYIRLLIINDLEKNKVRII